MNNKCFEKFLKLNNIMTAFPDDADEDIKDELVDNAKEKGFSVFSKILVNNHLTWLISKKELSSFQLRRMEAIMEEYVKFVVAENVRT